MTNIEKIGKFEAIALFITIITNNIILNMPTILLYFSGSGAWLNIIYITVISLLFILLVCKLFKCFVGLDILDVSEYLGGKFLKYIIAILYLVMFICFSAFCVRYFANSLKIIYFNHAPLVWLILLLLIPAVISSKAGLKAVSGTNMVFFPIIIFSIFVFTLAALKYATWENLFPVFGYGIKETLIYQIPNIFAFNVLAYLYFMKPFLKDEKHFKKISIFAVILCGIYLLISVVALITTFPFITQTDETFSVYLVTRLISFGQFFQRVDAIFIFIWILTLLSFLSLNIFIISHIIKKTVSLQSHSALVYGVSVIIFTVAIAFKDLATIKFIIRNIYRLYAFILIFIVSFTVLLFAYFKKKRKKECLNEIK